jgi:adenylate cyclase
VKICFAFRIVFILLGVAIACPILYCQSIPTTWVDSVLLELRNNQRIDAQTKSDLADSAFSISVRNKQICKQIESRVLQSTNLDNLGETDSALVQLYWANQHFSDACDSLLLMELYSNITRVFVSLGEFSRLDSIAKLMLHVWNPTWTANNARLAVLNNWAIGAANSGELQDAMRIFRQAYNEARKTKNLTYEQIGLNNLGSMQGMAGNLDSAYYFFARASNIAKANLELDNYMSILINMANLDAELGRYTHAEILLDSAYALADTTKNLEKKASIQRSRADLYALAKDYKKAFSFLIAHIDLREAFLNEERVMAVTEMQAKYESEKKARQIQQLEIENLDANLQNEKIRHTRNRMIYIGGGILLFAIGLWTRLRLVHRSRRAIQKEKDISEGLLLNILPAAVAEELKAKGAAEAKLYEQATILFSDFKSFTEVAGEMSAAELVHEINVCFKAFDEIMEQFGLEKIKTIGDSYMAAGAVPDDNKAEAIHVVQAALAMQDFIAQRKQVRDDANQLGFEMRVGIHTGPVVAGIVGIKKFQYDLWGDTVNIASRMETNSEPGQVNISAVTYELVKHEPELSFTPRGMIEVKGKGAMMMYFVNRERARELVSE